jgi:hypothetical protein
VIFVHISEFKIFTSGFSELRITIFIIFIKNIMKVFFYISLTILFLGCKKAETDNQKPFITILKPANHANISLGHNLLYEIELKDDFQLVECRIKIQSATIPMNKNIESNLWDTTFVKSISGIEAYIKDQLLVPSIIDSGRYLFMVYCKDKTGNEEFTARDFKVITAITK